VISEPSPSVSFPLQKVALPGGAAEAWSIVPSNGADYVKLGHGKAENSDFSVFTPPRGAARPQAGFMTDWLTRGDSAQDSNVEIDEVSAKLAR
jgi:hypothetical protein